MFYTESVFLPTHRHAFVPTGYFFLTLAILAVGLIASVYVYVAIDRSGRAHILDRASTIAETIPDTSIRLLSGTERDLGSPFYRELKSMLIRVRGVNPDIRFIYLIGKDKTSELFFYLDSEETTSPDYSPPGQVYEEASSAMYEFFDNGTPLTEGPDRDRWGVWISGYAPVTDSSGKVVALLGIDLPASQYLFDIFFYSALPMVFALMIFGFLFALERTRLREMRSIEQKEEFLSIASHEIRTPLTGIRWAMETLMSDKSRKLSRDTRRILQLTHDNVLGIIARINNLLEVKALEHTGTSRLVKETVAVHSLMEEIVTSLTLPAEEHGILLTVDAKVPKGATLSGDLQLLRQALFNLVTNAIKYTKKGTTVTISYTRDTKKKIHTIAVTDEGKGIAPEDQGYIFNGYHRSKEASQGKEVGTGLGLYLVKKVAELHGGSVRVESKKDKGSTFSLSIPG